MLRLLVSSFYSFKAGVMTKKKNKEHSLLVTVITNADEGHVNGLMLT